MSTNPTEVIKDNLMQIPTNLMATLQFLPAHMLIEWLAGMGLSMFRGPQDTWQNEIISDVILGTHVLTQFELENGVYCQ